MYAVVSSGGKQYRVEPGSTLIMDRLADDAGASVTFDRVLMVGDGETVLVGTPVVGGASVRGTVLGPASGPKIVVFKFKQKVKYRRRTGHRQRLTRVRIDEISANGRTESAPEAESTSTPRARRASSASAAAPKRKATARTAKPRSTAKGKAPTERASASASAGGTEGKDGNEPEPRRGARSTSKPAGASESKPRARRTSASPDAKE